MNTDKILNVLAKTRLDYVSKYFYSGHGHILMLHRVLEDTGELRLKSNKSMEITPDYLEKLIQFFIQKKYNFISLDTLHSGLVNNNIKNKFVVFTLDDGYIDNYTFAFPIFKKYNIPFTIYVSNSFPNNTAILWWYLLEDILLKNKELHFTINNIDYNLCCNNVQEKDSCFRQVHQIVVSKDQNNYLSTLESIFKNYINDLYGKTKSLALSWEKIIELSKHELVTIGSHTVNHLCLSNLNELEMKSEILNSKTELEGKLGKEIYHLAYPYGYKQYVGEREFIFAEQAGFKTATTTLFANVFTQHHKHICRLPRIHINGNSTIGHLHRDMSFAMGATPMIINKFKRIVY